MKLKINNSFCNVEEADPYTNSLITELLTYKNDIEAEKGQLFHQLRLAKRYNNEKMKGLILSKLKHLEKTEFVCLYQNNSFPTGLLNIVIELLNEVHTQYSVVDLRVIPGKSVILRWNNKPFEPRYYQSEMIKQGLLHGRGVFEAAVGSGKSLVMAYIIKEISVNTLIVVPSKGLADQIYNDFVVWFGDKNVQFIDAKKVRKNSGLALIRIITIQSLASLQKSGEIQELVHDVDAIHYDEFHHSASSSFTKLLPELSHIYYRFGYTGTFLRNDNKILELWGVLSNILYKYPAHQAIKDKFLTPIQNVVHQIDGKSNMKYQTEYDNNYCGSAELLDQIHQIYQSLDSDVQVLILVNKKDKSGLIVHEYLKTLGIENSYISGDNKKEEISRTISNFNDKKIRVLIGSSVIAEGIDIRSTDHLINLKGGKSEIVLIQSIGRAVRLYKGKSIAYIHDFHFTNTNYLEKHFFRRQEIIKDNFL